MTAPWDALGARARGLATHLLGDDRLRALERAADVRELVRLLDPSPYMAYLPPHETAVEAVDLAIARSAANRMDVLSRWAGPDSRLLTVVFLEQDARNVRLIIRGIVGGVARDRRLSGVMPTPTLGRRALETLAFADSTGSVAATLTAWSHTLGPPLLQEARRAKPDLFRLETALARSLADRALREAPRAGRQMSDFVRETLDAQNVLTALLIAGARTETEPAELFVEGGTALGSRAFVDAAMAPNRQRAADVLGRATRRTVFAAPLRQPPATPTALSRRILEARIERLRLEGLAQPISALPVLYFLLRLRREVNGVRRSVWRASLQRERAS